MKKITIIVLVCICQLLMLTACSKNTEADIPGEWFGDSVGIYENTGNTYLIDQRLVLEDGTWACYADGKADPYLNGRYEYFDHWTEYGTWTVEDDTISFERESENYPNIGPSEVMKIDYENMKMEGDSASFEKAEEDE